MLMPIIQAYVGDITPPGKEGFTMGLFNMSMFCGLSLGPFLGGVIHDRFSLQTSFVCMGLLALIGFFLCQFLLPPTRSEKYITSGKVPHRWKQLFLDRDIASIFIFRFSHILCIGIIWAFLPAVCKIKVCRHKLRHRRINHAGGACQRNTACAHGAVGGQNQQKMDGGHRRFDGCVRRLFFCMGAKLLGDGMGQYYFWNRRGHFDAGFDGDCGS